MTRPLTAGAEVREGAGRIYVNLRAGEIAQTQSGPADGFVAKTNRNASGTEYHFFAKPYHHITGIVTDIRWHSYEFQTGGSSTGWNVTIETPDEVFVLFVASGDPLLYGDFMNRMLSVDFTKLVYFRCYTNKAGYKNLIISQEMDDEGKPIWVEPLYQTRWMSLTLKEKIRSGVELDDKDKQNVKFDDQGKPDNSYPYILQKQDGKWSWDRWHDFLITLMKDEVLPHVKSAADARGNGHTAEEYSGPQGDAYEPEQSAPVGAVPPDDDIPF